jgi:predicted porin
MKKTLIAVAALAATASFAQVSVYGRLDVGYGAYTSTDAAGVDTKRNGVSSHNSVSSMWGIKGTEDLGSGLKAFFILEQDVYTANGNTGDSGAKHGATSNGAFDRTSLVGVEGGFGKVAFGRDYTPMFKLIGSSDIHALSNLSTVNTANAAGGSTLPNQVFYSTPNLSGFVGNLSLINTDNSVGGAVNKVEGLNVTGVYNNGPLMVGAGMGNQKTTTATESKTEATALSAAYNFGTFALRGGLTSAKTTTAGAVVLGSEIKETNLGATIPLGKVTLGAQVGKNDNGVDTGTDMILSADYALSAKTALYAKTGTYNKYGDAKVTGTAMGIKTVF